MKNKKIIFYIFLLIGLLLLFITYLIYKEQTVAVLGYHSFTNKNRIKNNITDNMIMDIDKFEKQLKYLKRHNYKTLTLNEFYCFHENKCRIPRKSVLITMDDGYKSNIDLAFPLLKKYNMNAVVFYIGINSEEKYKNYMTLKDLKIAKERYPNIEFASHSYNLHLPDAINNNKTYFINDIKEMKKLINSKYYAYPYGKYNEEMINALQEEKYKMAFTFGPNEEHRKASRKDNKYKIPRLNISNDMPMWKFIIRIKLPK